MYIFLRLDVHPFVDRCTSFCNEMYILLRLDVHLFSAMCLFFPAWTIVPGLLAYYGDEASPWQAFYQRGYCLHILFDEDVTVAGSVLEYRHTSAVQIKDNGESMRARLALRAWIFI